MIGEWCGRPTCGVCTVHVQDGHPLPGNAGPRVFTRNQRASVAGGHAPVQWADGVGDDCRCLARSTLHTCIPKDRSRHRVFVEGFWMASALG